MSRAALFAVLLLVCGAAAGAPVEKRVYKVDSVVATQKGRMLTILAKGAVQSGGWHKPKLRAMRGAEPRTMVVEFLAVPPPPGMTVIQALVPVQAVVRLPAPRRTLSVRAVAEANEVTTQVLH